MLYRIRLDLAFNDPDPVNDILDKALDVFEDAMTINPGRFHNEPGFITTEICYHDEDLSKPCTILKEFLTD